MRTDMKRCWAHGPHSGKSCLKCSEAQYSAKHQELPLFPKPPLGPKPEWLAAGEQLDNYALKFGTERQGVYVGVHGTDRVVYMPESDEELRTRLLRIRRGEL